MRMRHAWWCICLVVSACGQDAGRSPMLGIDSGLDAENTTADFSSCSYCTQAQRGYDWAGAHAIQSPGQCQVKGQTKEFIADCLAYVQEQQIVMIVRAALQGNAGAQFDLATLYAEGFKIARDDRTALAWFQRASLQGYLPAQHSMQQICMQRKIESDAGPESKTHFVSTSDEQSIEKEQATADKPQSLDSAHPGSAARILVDPCL